MSDQLKNFNETTRSVSDQLKDFDKLYSPQKFKINDQVVNKLKLFFKALEVENSKTQYYGKFVSDVNNITNRIDDESDPTHFYEVMKIVSSSKTCFTKNFTVKLMKLFSKKLGNLNSCQTGALSPAECKKIIEINVNSIGKTDILIGGFDELKAAIGKLEVGAEIVFILKPDANHAHVLPLILKKESEILKILCFDSRGKEKETFSWIDIVTDELSPIVWSGIN